jgi:hypothetical protein
MVSILSMLTDLRTALDYAKPTQRALLVEGIYSLNDGLDNSSYNSFGFESNSNRGNANSNSSRFTALYHRNGPRYGLGLGGNAMVRTVR